MFISKKKNKNKINKKKIVALSISIRFIAFYLKSISLAPKIVLRNAQSYDKDYA